VRIFDRPAAGLAVTIGVPAMPHAKRAERPKMQPPMTAMIDCTFNLLIFFILTPAFALRACDFFARFFGTRAL